MDICIEVVQVCKLGLMREVVNSGVPIGGVGQWHIVQGGLVESKLFYSELAVSKPGVGASGSSLLKFLTG